MLGLVRESVWSRESVGFGRLESSGRQTSSYLHRIWTNLSLLSRPQSKVEGGEIAVVDSRTTSVVEKS
jgi:hypothetical protein